MFDINGDLDERTANFVKDLMATDDDVDEAELPALAGRRPVVLAVAAGEA